MSDIYIPESGETVPDYAMIPAGEEIIHTGEEETSISETEYRADEGKRIAETGISLKSDSVRGRNETDFSLSGKSVSKNAAVHNKQENGPEAEIPVKLVSAADDLKSTRLRLSGVHSVSLPDIHIEEDILVPDTRADLEKIISITASAEVTSHESYAASDGTQMLRIGGNLDVSTLYLPSGRLTELVSVTSKIPFRKEYVTPKAVSDSAEISVQGVSVSSKVINERKIRISADASFTAREYGDTEIELLEGVRDDSILLKKEKIRFTDMAQRRTDTVDIREKIRLKDSLPIPGRILRYDTDITENRRQLSNGKAVIEASLYYSILYVPGSDGDEEQLPVFMREKTEFTQFLRLPELNDSETAGSIVNFEILNSDISLRSGDADLSGDMEDIDEEDYGHDDGSGSAGEGMPYFLLEASVATGIQVYRNLEREVVTDMYHRSRKLDFSSSTHEISELCGNGTADISVRETINIPESKGSAAAVPYIYADIKSIKAAPDQDRCAIEGSLAVSVVYSDEATGEICCFDTAVPFRTVTDVPGICSASRIECVPGMKDIRFERMNSHQADFSCSISVRICAWNAASYEFIDRVCYVDDGKAGSGLSGIVVYMIKPGDTQWSVSKKFRTSVDVLQEINGLEADQELIPGMRLLIV